MGYINIVIETKGIKEIVFKNNNLELNVINILMTLIFLNSISRKKGKR